MKKLIGLFLLLFIAFTPVSALSDITLPFASWTDLTDELNLIPGQSTTLQNTGRTTLRITTNTSIPVTVFEGLVAPSDSVTTFDVRPVGSERIWVYNTAERTTGQINSISDMSVTPSNAIGAPLSFGIELAGGRIPGKSLLLNFGKREDLPGTPGDFATIWDGPTDTYVPPTQGRLHDVVSTDVDDVGTEISSGTVTTTARFKVIDINATFISDGVSVGDNVVNDSKSTASLGGVISIDSETELTVGFFIFGATGLDASTIEAGDDYRVINSSDTGAAFIFLQGLDNSRLRISEFIILNGTTDVPTVETYVRQTLMAVFAAGSSFFAEGTITSTAQTDLTVTAQITAGKNQAFMTIQTIPSNKRAYLRTWRASHIRRQATVSAVRLKIGSLDGVNYTLREESLNTTGSGSFEHDVTGFILQPGSDVWMEADSDAMNVGISASFDIILEDI